MLSGVFFWSFMERLVSLLRTHWNHESMLHKGLAVILPLPEGEGRGEGEFRRATIHGKEAIFLTLELFHSF